MLIKLSVPRDFTVTVSFVFTFACADSTLNHENDSKILTHKNISNLFFMVLPLIKTAF